MVAQKKNLYQRSLVVDYSGSSRKLLSVMRKNSAGSVRNKLIILMQITLFVNHANKNIRTNFLGHNQLDFHIGTTLIRNENYF